MYSQCIVCNKQLIQPNSDTLYSTLDSLLPFMEEPISFYEAINLFSNFADLNIDTTSAIACDSCFMLAKSAVCFQQMCHRAFCNIQAHQCNENKEEEIKDLIAIVENPITNCTSELQEGIVHVKLPPYEINTEVNLEGAEVDIESDANSDENGLSEDESKLQFELMNHVKLEIDDFHTENIIDDANTNQEHEENENISRSESDDNASTYGNAHIRHYSKQTTQFVTKRPHLPRKVKRKRVSEVDLEEAEVDILPKLQAEENCNIEKAKENFKEKEKYPSSQIELAQSCSSSHLKTRISEGKYNCNKCSRSFAWKRSLRRHIASYHCINPKPPKMKTCPICNKEVTANNISHHVLTHTERKYKCNICRKMFKTERYLREHIEYHCINPKPFKMKTCHICNKELAAPYISQHLLTHAAMKYKCTNCQKMFRTNTYLRVHMEYHCINPKPPKMKTCHICNKEVTARCFSRHFLTHIGKKNKCSICQKMFRTKWYLRVHMNKFHTDERPPKCEQDIV